MRHCRQWVRFCTVAAFMVVILGGCATSATAPVSDYRSSPLGADDGTITQGLYNQLERWRGTRYRLGGLGRQGVDCSGLTYVIFRDLFGKHLPRTTDEQEEIGRAVKRRSLAPGDLVFFKTGIVQKHVGIYVEDGKFLHASRRHGVQLSSLGSEYWRDRYLKARRLSVVQAEL